MPEDVRLNSVRKKSSAGQGYILTRDEPEIENKGQQHIVIGHVATALHSSKYLCSVSVLSS